MLRRRILASAMASVMAIGSVAVVANAEDAAASTAKVKTKADLEAYVKSFDSFRVSGINNYGSISGDRFSAMCDFAENIIADPASTVDDYTAAYMMLESVYNNLKLYTVEELKALIDANKKVYETNNIMNEEYGDAIYKDDKGQWGNFTNAYETAESVLDSSDSRIISDAYEELVDAKDKLSALTVVTKAQFRSAMKNLETALQREYKFDAWRRGTIVDSTWSVQWAFDNSTYSWGSIFYAVNNMVADITKQYEELNNRKSVNKTTNEDITKAYGSAVSLATVLNSFEADDTVRGSKSSVQALLNQYHGLLVMDYATTAALDLEAEIARQGGVTAKGAFDVTTTTVGVATAASHLHPEWKGAEKNIAASLTIKTKDPLYLITRDGYADIYNENGEYDDTKIASVVKTTNTGLADGQKAVRINKNVSFDIAKYIKVDADDIDFDYDNHENNDIYDGDTYPTYSDHWAGHGGHPWDTGSVVGSWILQAVSNGNFTNTDGEPVMGYTTLDKAMALAEFYLKATKDDWKNSDIYSIDDTDSIAADSAKGSSAEWTLVYRYLKYALEDKYKGSTDSFTKADVVKLIEESYDLTEKTGDAAMFSYNHNALVEVRQNALEWLKVANKDKKYKDNTMPYDFGATEATATGVYNALNGAYYALKADYDAFSISFGDIYYRLAEIADMIDNGDIVATDDIIRGLQDVAFKLVTVQSLDDEIGVAIENDVFTVDYALNKVNRVFTKGAEHYKELDIDATYNRLTVPTPDADHPAARSHDELYKAFTALNDEVKKQTEPTTVVGDVNGDGVVNALDAAAILKAVAAGTAIDVAVGDYNADGVVNALDAAAILKAVTQA